MSYVIWRTTPMYRCYVYMYLCMYGCTYVCVCVCEYVSIEVENMFLCVRMYAWLSVFVYSSVSVSLSIYI